ncbi:lycopene beta cyclase, chloroplastic chromoplastic [Olea europaea subsp. europaea]|uniref:Lycopene beta cyclase, chloroplastic chromoplastic n=1 Tax=Olea europaea subsp. europaea TaxID=158383 RepID=A0A8S0U9Y8_OLEEU|nr:lycopene beta cyclase, chloroplastic chromoplastic [Olea europaea subsp. europaea]
MPFSSKRIFLEDTSLVARPGVLMDDIKERMSLLMDDIKERMVAQLSHLVIKVRNIKEDEHCVIPMGALFQCYLKELLGLAVQLGWCTHRLDIWWQGLWLLLQLLPMQ